VTDSDTSIEPLPYKSCLPPIQASSPPLQYSQSNPFTPDPELYHRYSVEGRQSNGRTGTELRLLFEYNHRGIVLLRPLRCLLSS
jgi:hypothetical protein